MAQGPDVASAINAKASVVTAALEITYVLFEIVDVKLEHSEHYSKLSDQMLSSGDLASKPFRLVDTLVAKPIRLPFRVIVLYLSHLDPEQPQILAVVLSSRVNQISLMSLSLSPL